MQLPVYCKIVLLCPDLLSIMSSDKTEILICEKVKQYTTLNKYLIIIRDDVLTYINVHGY